MKMSDDNSNDVVMLVEDNEEDSGPSEASRQLETRPLMQLFQRLISNDSKQNTVLTNAQIISILHKEFDIDITTIHDLEVDMYLNTVKRFLKDWPQWDEFDRGINWLRKKKHAEKSVNQTLENNYKNLKLYLKVQIDAITPLAQEAVSKITTETMKKMEQVDTSDVVLEVYCTRKQLNELIYSHPNPETENSVFHLSEFEPSSISVNSLPMESIINWWGVQVSIELKSLALTWTTSHKVSHVLVNSKNGPRNLKTVLNEHIQIKEQKRSTENVEKSNIYAVFDSILTQYPHRDKTHPLVKALFYMIQKDFELVDGAIKVPAIYRKRTNKYPYYRKLCKNNEKTAISSGKVYDFYLEETLVPMHVYYIGKVGSSDAKVVSGSLAHNTWLTVECVECKTKFTGIDLRTHMKEHFDMYHANEPDWICTNCEKTFPMITLTKNRWHHICEQT